MADDQKSLFPGLLSGIVDTMRGLPGEPYPADAPPVPFVDARLWKKSDGDPPAGWRVVSHGDKAARVIIAPEAEGFDAIGALAADFEKAPATYCKCTPGEGKGGVELVRCEHCGRWMAAATAGQLIDRLRDTMSKPKGGA